MNLLEDHIEPDELNILMRKAGRIIWKLEKFEKFSFFTVKNIFKNSIYSSNVGEFSDLNVERVDASIGLDYIYKPYLSFYAKYNYRDYNDREVNELDGTAHLISFGMNYTF